MPRLPQPTAQGRAAVLSLPQPSARQFGAEAAEQLSEFGQTLQATAEKIQHNQDQLDVVKMASDYELAMDAKRTEIAQTTDLTQHRTLYEEADAEVRQKILSSYPLLSSAAKQTFTMHATSHFTRQAIDLAHEGNKVAVERQLVDVSQRGEDIAVKQGRLEPFAALSLSGDARARTDHMLRSFSENGTLHPVMAQKLREDWNNKFWEQRATQHPEYTKHVIESGVVGIADFQMDQSKSSHYENLADQTIRGRDAEVRRLKAEAKEAELLAQQNTQNDFLARIQTGTLTTPDILDSNLKPVGDGSKEHFLNVLVAHSKEKANPIQSNPRLFADTMRDIRSLKITNENELDRIYNKSAADGSGIDYEDLLKLRKEFEELKTPDGQTLARRKDILFDGIKHSITDSVMDRNDPEGDTMFAYYQSWVNTQLEQARTQGKSPHLLMMPRIDGKENPEFLGRAEAVAPFQRTLKEQIAGISNKLKRKERPEILDSAPESMKRKPGETYAQWRKRNP